MTFPYSIIFEKYNNIIRFLQYIIIIIFILFLYEYIQKNIDEIMNYLKINIKDNILIPYMEQDELKRIYIIIDNLCFLFYFFALFYYIIKFFDILLINIVYIHFIITLILLIIEMAAIFVYFISLTYITYLLNKNYHKGKIIPTDEDGENLSKKKKKIIN